MFGHGVKAKEPEDIRNGALEWDKDKYFTFSLIQRHRYLKYALGINYHCHTNLAEWRKASLNYVHGLLIPIVGITFQVPTPYLTGVFGSWDTIVGSAADRVDPILEEPNMFN